MERRADGYLVSSDPALWDAVAIHASLTTSYWAEGIPLDIVERSLAASVGAGAYLEPDGPGGRTVQVGFARVVTDRATFAWLCDVYVLPEHQGRGLAQRMMALLLDLPELQGLRRWMLGTRDAHSLYERFGFRPLPEPSRYLQLPSQAPYGPKRPPPTGS